MRATIRLTSALLVTAAFLPAGAMAADEAPVADVASVDSGDTTAAAASAQSDDQVQGTPSRGDVIIVTARRRQETAQEVPLAISVIRGDSIEATGNFNVVKLQQLAPTLQVYTSNPRNTSVNIRGLGVPFGLT